MAVNTVINNGSSDNRIDLVILSEGYTEAQVGASFAADASGLTAYLFGGSVLTQPFGTYANFFNVHLVPIVSSESGADNPGTSTTVNTALGATYYYDGVTERLLYIDDTLANTALNSALSGTGFTAEIKFVAVNSEKYGGGGGSYGVFAAKNAASLEVAVHEIGHSFAGLADEYGGNIGPYTGSDPSAVNITTDSTGAKWTRWLGYDQPGIGVIGAYEGGGYYNTGIYRPSNASKMNVLNNPFDAISREAFVLKFYDIVDPLDDYAFKDHAGPIIDPATLWVDTIDDDVIDVEWYVDGVRVALPDVTTVTLADLGLTSGSHEVKVRAFDPTDWVRVNDRSTLEQEVVWTVVVGPSQGTISFAQAVANHGALDINEVVKNYLNSQLFGQGVVSDVTYGGNGDASYLILDEVLGGAGLHSGGILLTSGTLPSASNTGPSFGRSNGVKGDADLDASVQNAFSGAGSTNDASVIKFTVDVTDSDVDGIKFDIIFGSDEYPEYSDTKFVDIAAIYVNGQNYALFNGSAASPLSVLSGNLGYFIKNSSGSLPIEWDGVSSKLTIRAPVHFGENTIKIAIADTGDYVYDSGLYVEDIEFTKGGATTGKPMKSVDGTAGNDNFDASGLNEAFELKNGSDKVYGSLAQLDGDVIVNFDADDAVIFKNTLFDTKNVVVKKGSAIIEVDTDLNGTPDSILTLAGHFEKSNFVFTQVNGNTEMTVQTAPSGGIVTTLSFAHQLEVIYFGYFNRAADGQGFNFWLDQNTQAQIGGQGAEQALNNIANSFRPQTETLALYPALGVETPDFSSPSFQVQLSTFIDDVYQNLFNRTPDAEGKAYWTTQTSSGVVGFGAAILSIANGAIGQDATFIVNKAEAAAYFTDVTSKANAAIDSLFFAKAAAAVSSVNATQASVDSSKAETDLYIAALPAPELYDTADIWALASPDDYDVDVVGLHNVQFDVIGAVA